MKILKEIIKLRRQDQDERDEHESLLDVDMRAMEKQVPLLWPRRPNRALKIEDDEKAA